MGKSFKKYLTDQDAVVLPKPLAFNTRPESIFIKLPNAPLGNETSKVSLVIYIPSTNKSVYATPS